MSVLIGIDIGGTFTDIVTLNEDTGELKVTKVPSTPGEFSIKRLLYVSTIAFYYL